MIRRLLSILIKNLVFGFLASSVITIIVLYRGQPQLLILIVFGNLLIQLGLTISSLSILLCLVESVSQSLFLKILSFFLLPAIVSFTIITEANDDFTFYVISCGVFFMISLYSFLRYIKVQLHKQLKNGKLGLPLFLSQLSTTIVQRMAYGLLSHFNNSGRGALLRQVRFITNRLSV